MSAGDMTCFIDLDLDPSGIIKLGAVHLMQPPDRRVNANGPVGWTPQRIRSAIYVTTFTLAERLSAVGDSGATPRTFTHPFSS